MVLHSRLLSGWLIHLVTKGHVYVVSSVRCFLEDELLWRVIGRTLADARVNDNVIRRSARHERR